MNFKKGDKVVLAKLPKLSNLNVCENGVSWVGVMLNLKVGHELIINNVDNTNVRCDFQFGDKKHSYYFPPQLLSHTLGNIEIIDIRIKSIVEQVNSLILEIEDLKDKKTKLENNG